MQPERVAASEAVGGPTSSPAVLLPVVSAGAAFVLCPGLAVRGGMNLSRLHETRTRYERCGSRRLLPAVAAVT
jgi:hypothetical protein